MRETMTRRGLWIAALLLFVFLMSGCSAEQVLPDGVSVEVEPRDSGPRITVRAELHDDYVSQLKGEVLYLFAIAPGQPVDTAGLSPVGECRVSGKMTYRLDDVTESALYSGYVLAQRRDDGSYRVITNPVYLTNPDALGRAEKEARTSYPDMSSIKGLWLADPDAPAQTRADHTVLTLPLGDYLAFSGAEDTIRYHFDGITFYLRRDAVLRLDRRIRALPMRGCTPIFALSCGECPPMPCLPGFVLSMLMVPSWGLRAMPFPLVTGRASCALPVSSVFLLTAIPVRMGSTVLPVPSFWENVSTAAGQVIPAVRGR